MSSEQSAENPAPSVESSMWFDEEEMCGLSQNIWHPLQRRLAEVRQWLVEGLIYIRTEWQAVGIAIFLGILVTIVFLLILQVSLTADYDPPLFKFAGGDGHPLENNGPGTAEW
ncbi:hypothetical protein K438DRAFT_1960348 [Mycena galopus ATCC 62051]|nr:hypothetical protein K438DRAFT_1960348 [Mycena galopus ATCC 62051]